MKAYEIQRKSGGEAVALVERSKPNPRPNQVLLRMRAASLNYRDLVVAKGAYGGDSAVPLIPLSDGVGTVVEVGDLVQGIKPGDRVAGSFMPGWISGRLDAAKGKTALGGAVDGVLAEYVALDGQGVIPVPEHLTDEEAATLPCAAVTAWNALFVSGKVTAGETVLVQGTGGVSLFALQFARLAGARVLVTSSSNDKLARACQLGAAEGCNYRTNPDWDDWAFQQTGRVGVDHVVEVGGAGTLSKSLRAVRVGGDISLIGILTGVKADIPTVHILQKAIRVLGIYVGSREMFEAMNRAIRLHQLRPIVDRVFPFELAGEAYRHLASGQHFGKVVIRIGDS